MLAPWCMPRVGPSKLTFCGHACVFVLYLVFSGRTHRSWPWCSTCLAASPSSPAHGGYKVQPEEGHVLFICMMRMCSNEGQMTLAPATYVDLTLSLCVRVLCACLLCLSERVGRCACAASLEQWAPARGAHRQQGQTQAQHTCHSLKWLIGHRTPSRSEIKARPQEKGLETVDWTDYPCGIKLDKADSFPRPLWYPFTSSACDPER